MFQLPGLIIWNQVNVFVQFLFFHCRIFSSCFGKYNTCTKIEINNNVILPVPRLKNKSEKKWYLRYLLKHWLPVAPGHQQWLVFNWCDFMFYGEYFDGLVQERLNSIANALELRLSWTNPSIYARKVMFPHINSTRQISNDWKQRVRTQDFSLDTPWKLSWLCLVVCPLPTWQVMVKPCCNSVTYLFIIFFPFIFILLCSIYTR